MTKELGDFYGSTWLITAGPATYVRTYVNAMAIGNFNRMIQNMYKN